MDVHHATGDTVGLRHGARMPLVGFGTGTKLTPELARDVIPAALRAGYRMIDTAERYGNEAAIGAALRDSGTARDDVFITTKLNAQWHGVDLARQAFERSAARLGVERIDLMLIHWPNPQQDRYVQAWRGLIQLLNEGRLRAIGTSNFTPRHLERIIGETGVVPDVNQIQLNPTAVRAEARAFHGQHGIVTQSWAPLGKGAPFLADPVVTELAARHGKTPVQVVLRWHLELGVVAQPGTANPAHIADNLAIFDFELGPEAVRAISALDVGTAVLTDPDSFGH